MSDISITSWWELACVVFAVSFIWQIATLIARAVFRFNPVPGNIQRLIEVLDRRYKPSRSIVDVSEYSAQRLQGLIVMLEGILAVMIEHEKEKHHD